MSSNMTVQHDPKNDAPHYLYTTDYEFLVNGSEDEENLTRLTEEQAAEYLNRPAPD